MREEGKATAQAAITFLGAYLRLWVALAGDQHPHPPHPPPRGSELQGGSGRGFHLQGTPVQPVLPSLQDLMTQNGISYVLNASNSCPKPDFICESRFMRIPINDNYCEKLLPWLDKSIEFIGEGRGGAGVSCRWAGRTLGRSTATPVLGPEMGLGSLAVGPVRSPAWVREAPAP